MRFIKIQRDIENHFKKNIQRAGETAEKVVNDFALHLNEGKAKTFLNSALDVLRPHFVSLGARVSILSQTKIEVLLPLKSRNIDEQGRVIPGVQTSLAIECFKMLWSRKSPLGVLSIRIKEVKSQFFRETSSDLIFRSSLSETHRELVWSLLHQDKKADVELGVLAFDLDGQTISEFEIVAEIITKDLLR